MAIDIAQIAPMALSLLGMLGQPIANAIIENALERLIEAIRARFDEDQNDKRILGQWEKDPADVRLQADLTARLAAKITADPGFRRELAHLVEELGNKNIVPLTQPAPPPAALCQLPADIADFTGREKELTALLEGAREAKGAPAILVVTGIGGSGKSALTLHAAHLLRGEFPDVQLYVDLRGAGSLPLDPRDVLASFLRALGVEERAIPLEREDRARLYRSLLSGKRVLVLLDNARGEPQVRPLLPGCSTCAVLVTSRRSLSALEGAIGPLRLAMLTDQDALALLVRLIGKDRVSTEAELKAANRIVRLCGRLPLAVRIAGGRLKTGYELQDYASRLEGERGRLRQLHLGDLNVRSSFSVSYHNLSHDEARLFRLLGLLPGESFTSEAATALAGAEEDYVWDLLDRLVNAQLLELVGGSRYSFHDLVHLFAWECLADEEPEERKSARLRVARWYAEKSRAINDWLQPDRRLVKVAELARQTLRPPEEISRNEMLKALTWFEMERANLLAAVEWAHEGQLWEPTWQLAQNLANFYNLRGHWADWERTHVLALEATRKKRDTRNEGIILNLLGNVYRLQGRWNDAIDLFQQARALSRKVPGLYEGNPLGEAIALNLLANTYRLQGRWDEAIATFEESRQINLRLGNRHGEGIALGGLGNVYRMQGRWDDALSVYKESLKISDEVHDRRGQCITLNNIGRVYTRQNRLDEADALLAKSLSICAEMNLPRGECIARRIVGEVRMRQNRWNEALESLTRSLELARRQEDRRCICQTLNCLGEWHTRQGRWEEASRCFEEARALLREMGDRHGEGLVLRNEAILLAAQDRLDQAEKVWQEALEKLHPSSPEHRDGVDLSCSIEKSADGPTSRNPGSSSSGV